MAGKDDTSPQSLQPHVEDESHLLEREDEPQDRPPGGGIRGAKLPLKLGPLVKGGGHQHIPIDDNAPVTQAQLLAILTEFKKVIQQELQDYTKSSPQTDKNQDQTPQIPKLKTTHVG